MAVRKSRFREFERPKPLPTTQFGIRFRSRAEARWAIFFTSLGLRWSFEHQAFGRGRLKYLPDFYLPDCRIWVEVKTGWPDDEAKKKCELLHDATGELVVIACNGPSLFENTLVYGWPESGFWSEPMAWFEDRLDKGVLWLCGDDGEFCIGGWGSPTPHSKHSVQAAVIKAAASAAQTERFGT